MVLDTETTGLGEDAEIVEMAIVGPSGQVLFDKLVQPSAAIEYEAARLHRFDPLNLEAAPPFEAIYPILKELLSGRTIVAFHADFDRRVIDSSCRGSSLRPIEGRWACALERYESWRGFRASLGTVCEIEGIPVTDRHRAVGDAFLVWTLLKRMVGLPS